MHFVVVSLLLVGLPVCNRMPQILGGVHAHVYTESTLSGSLVGSVSALQAAVSRSILASGTFFREKIISLFR